VNRASIDSRNGVFDKAGFVDRVRMNCNLYVRLIGCLQTGVDRRRCRAPILVQLQSARTCLNLFGERQQ
jgi:hypothetical protein